MRSLFSISVSFSTNSGHFIKMQSCHVWPFLIRFFHILNALSLLLHVLILHVWLILCFMDVLQLFMHSSFQMLLYFDDIQWCNKHYVEGFCYSSIFYFSWVYIEDWTRWGILHLTNCQTAFQNHSIICY